MHLVSRAHCTYRYTHTHTYTFFSPHHIARAPLIHHSLSLETLSPVHFSLVFIALRRTLFPLSLLILFFATDRTLLHSVQFIVPLSYKTHGNRAAISGEQHYANKFIDLRSRSRWFNYRSFKRIYTGCWYNIGGKKNTLRYR